MTEPAAVELPRLDFLNPEGLEPGQVFTTCRKGGKWADRVQVGSRVLLGVTDGPALREARVVALFACDFKDTPQHYLTANHDTSARTFEGLTKAMERAYGDIASNDLVTNLALEAVAEVTKPEDLDGDPGVNPLEPFEAGSEEEPATGTPPGTVAPSMFGDRPRAEVTYNEARKVLGLNPVFGGIGERLLNDVIGADTEVTIPALRSAMRTS